VKKVSPGRKALSDPTSVPGSVPDRVPFALAWLKAHSTKRDIDNLARFGIEANNAAGVSMKNIQALGKRLGRSHELAAALWETGCYEARMLTAFVDEATEVTAAQMDRWCRDFDNWAICDTLCFKLFDQTPHAWAKVEQWSKKRDEFGKRAAFALLASLALHDKQATDDKFLAALPLIERAAADERNFVKKGVSWALRSLGLRNAALRKAAIETATRLTESGVDAAGWIGRDALRHLGKRK
jgi:3-methyladenine DNA glycosylase AlkD